MKTIVKLCNGKEPERYDRGGGEGLGNLKEEPNSPACKLEK